VTTDTPPDFTDLARRMTGGCECCDCVAIRRVATTVGSAIAMTRDANPADSTHAGYVHPEAPVIMFAMALARLCGAGPKAFAQMTMHALHLADCAVEDAASEEARDEAGARRFLQALFGAPGADSTAGADSVASPQGHEPGNA
jgi:hypothetical protein